MQTVLEPQTSDADTTDDDIDHYFCEECDPTGQWAICGPWIGDAQMLDYEPDETLCVLCDLTDTCPRCGVELE